MILNVGKLKEYVGVTIERKNEKTVELSQPDSIKIMQQKFNSEIEKMKTFKSPVGPSDVVMHLRNENEKIDDDTQQRFQSGVGMLLWLAKHSRPDISNAVREVSKVMNGAMRAHYKYMLRIIKYVSDTKDKKLRLQPIDKDKEEKKAWEIHPH